MNSKEDPPIIGPDILRKLSLTYKLQHAKQLIITYPTDRRRDQLSVADGVEQVVRATRGSTITHVKQS